MGHHWQDQMAGWRVVESRVNVNMGTKLDMMANSDDMGQCLDRHMRKLPRAISQFD